MELYKNFPKTKPAYDHQEAIKLALRTWYPPDHPLHSNPHHPLGKLLGEWGELLDDCMKILYKPDYVFEPEEELGDIWYYLRILCYQKKITPKLIDYIIFPEIDTKIVFQENEIDILIKAAMYDASQVSLISETKSKKTICNTLSLSCQYSTVVEILSRENLTLNELTTSNWEKLKPGSERGEQWMKARKQNVQR